MRKVLLLLLAVLILACADKPEAKRDVYGVEIQEFRPDLEEVTAGNNAILRLKVQNVGDSDAKNVKAKIYSCGNLAIDSANCPTKEYALGTSGKLDGADISSNLPGGNTEKTFIVSTKSMRTMQNERVEQEIGLKISYDYESTASAEIPVLSNARYKELERQGTLPRTKVDSALAPIIIGIIAPEQAIGTEPLTIDIVIDKTIDGYAEGSGCKEGKTGCIDSVKIELSGKGLTKQDCADITGMQLWRTGKRTFTCTLKPDCSEGECSAVVKVTAKYRYVTEKSALLTVKGIAGGVSLIPGVSPPPSCGEGEIKSTRDVIEVDPQKGYVSQEITIKGTNFNANDENILIYAEGDKYWIEDQGEGIRRQTGLGYIVLEPITVTKGTRKTGNMGVDPAPDGTFTATYKIPPDIAMYEGGAQVNLFAVGELNKDRSITATEGYTNCKKLEVEPKAKITVSPSEASLGENVEIRGANFEANKDATIYLTNPSCANYLGKTPIGTGCTKHQIATKKTDSSGGFAYAFELNEAFLLGGNPAGGGYKIPAGYYLVYATAEGTNKFMSLNGAGELTIIHEPAEDIDGDGIANKDDQCTDHPRGVAVCSLDEAKIKDTECYGRAGCEKLQVSRADYDSKNPILALKINSKEETGDYTVTYDDKRQYSFIVKKNGVEAALEKMDVNDIPRAKDILFVFKIKNQGSYDLTTPIDVQIRGITKDDMPTENGHCMGITLLAGKEETCAILIREKDLLANAYTTSLKITKDGAEYIKKGFDFTVN